MKSDLKASSQEVLAGLVERVTFHNEPPAPEAPPALRPRTQNPHRSRRAQPNSALSYPRFGAGLGICAVRITLAIRHAIFMAGAVEVRVGDFSVANTLPTVNSPEQSVSRESEAAAKRMDTEEASMTRCWCQFLEARPKTASGKRMPLAGRRDSP